MLPELPGNCDRVHFGCSGGSNENRSDIRRLKPRRDCRDNKRNLVGSRTDNGIVEMKLTEKCNPYNPAAIAARQFIISCGTG
jgi:hypothetical protein